MYLLQWLKKEHPKLVDCMPYSDTTISMWVKDNFIFCAQLIRYLQISEHGFTI